MICVSVGRSRHKTMIQEQETLKAQGAQLIELRLDWLKESPDLKRLLSQAPTDIVVTCRRQADYGRWKGTEEQRLSLLRAVIVEGGANYIDLEDDIAADIPRYGETKRIISHHNFNETPSDLKETYERMTQLDPDVIKLTTMANSPEDSIRMLKLVSRAEIPTVGFCMGEFGFLSRMLCGKYGSPWTYASFSEERALAPGQISFRRMNEIYHYNKINAQTEVYGVLGDPIGHSMSPLIHNAAFQHDGINAVYLPFRVPKNQLEATIKAFQTIEVKGYSVTIPHKMDATVMVRFSDESVTTTGAANTLYQNEKGQWFSTNTDLEAALSSIRDAVQEKLNLQYRFEGKRILILGAGGVARAIALGLLRSGAIVTITNRNRKKAEELAKHLGCQFLSWENRGVEHVDILINCTPVGMHPDVNATPFPETYFKEGMVVFDTIYNPENTLLIKQAQERKCTTVSGVEMFVRQAAAQYECFTKQTAPVDLMRETFRESISPLNTL